MNSDSSGISAVSMSEAVATCPDPTALVVPFIVYGTINCHHPNTSLVFFVDCRVLPRLESSL